MLSSSFFTNARSARVCCLFLAALCCLWGASCAAPPQVLRLHVIAHSDAPEDQRVKLLVRDAVLQTTGGDLLASHTRGEARDALMADGAAVYAAVKRVLRENGCAYDARLSVGVYGFPESTYGDTLFPAGDYAALRVVLGAGRGRNWWCVLFPPLCIGGDEAGHIEYDGAGRVKWKSLLREWREGETQDATQSNQVYPASDHAADRVHGGERLRGHSPSDGQPGR